MIKKTLQKTIIKTFKELNNLFNSLKVIGKPKIFCIGLNKTGTTSLNAALVELGIVVACEKDAKILFKNWAERDFKPILKFCNRAQAFQDSPFSFPYTFVALQQKFPNSKFILTIRDDEEQWFNSITKFHSKLWANNDGIPPNKEQLLNAVNSYKGRPWDVNRILFDTPENEPYKKEVLLEFYNTYNKSVIDYFKTRPDQLLVINLTDKNAYKEFVNFIGASSKQTEFPWKNKT
ncbi:MAG: hypothetical protein ACJAT7_002777 [Psychromonas sp.]|jgi:hypothetical protein|uniref:sulfotransferase n=1 Tax=Psychromonas sp. TaxID=1884585 RepID=UPI0039E4ADDD